MYIKLFKDILAKNKNNNNPIYSFISVSNKCNANCKFCDIHEKKEINTSIDIKKLLKDLKESGIKYVHFTGGGEPLANKEIYSYFEEATNLGLNIVFITNGYFLNDKIIDELGKYNIKAIFFSIDSHIKEIHDKTRNVPGIFDKATYSINAIKLKYPNIKIIINHVLNRDNIDNLEDFIKMKNKYKYDYLNILIVKECPEYYFNKEQIINYNNKINNIKKLMKANNVQLLADELDYFSSNCYTEDGSDLRKNAIPCQILNYCCFIDCVSGNVYPCDCSVHRDYNYYCMGNIKQNSIKEIMNSEKTSKLRKELLKCSKCKSKCDYANMYFNKVINEKQ